MANADPEEWLPTSPASPWYPYGSKVTVYNNDGKVVYTGTVHDTGAGWDVNHHNVQPIAFNLDVVTVERGSARLGDGQQT